MILRAFGLRLRVGMFSRPLRGVGVLAMRDAGMNTTYHDEAVCEVRLGARVLRLLIPSVVVGVLIDRPSAVDAVEVTR